jgi:hypothetical protein
MPDEIVEEITNAVAMKKKQMLMSFGSLSSN